MAFRDLREYIQKSEEIGVLKRIDGVDWNLDLGALSDLYRRRKSILFDKIKGYPAGFRVFSNILATEAQQKLCMGIPAELGTLDSVRFLKNKFATFKPTPPVVRKTGPILENVLSGDKVDLLKFPTPWWHELDGGRYIGTADMVITRDPDDGWVNFGTYRVMVHDAKTTGIYIVAGRHADLIRRKYWAKGQACPVAVVCGEDPSVFIPSHLSVPYGVSEYDYAGWLRDKPVEVVKAPVTGLPIPAAAEIVLEGEIPPPEVETRLEGPFGEWTGYYASGQRNVPVIRVKSILHRNDPIITGVSSGLVPSEVRTSLSVSAILWNQLEQAGVPEVRGVWAMEPAGFTRMYAVSIKQCYAGHAKQAAMAVGGCRQGAHHSKFTIIVDEDIDPTIEDDVWFAVASRCDPATSIDIISGCWSDPLDSRLEPEKKDRGEYTHSKAIIYACKPYQWIDKFPPVVRSSPELLERVKEKYKGTLSDFSEAELKRILRAKVVK
ncbi:MAG: UbiD family decarboxylase [Chloroflexi bacterium]|nr:UbiD family decarboxylase [Chloroflexota bacterium]